MRDEEMVDESDVRDNRQNGANGGGKSLMERLGGPPLNHQAPEFHVGAGIHRGRGQGRPRGGHHGQNGRECYILFHRVLGRSWLKTAYRPPIPATDATAWNAEQWFLPASLSWWTGSLCHAEYNDAATGTNGADAVDDATNGPSNTDNWAFGSGKDIPSILPSLANSVTAQQSAPSARRNISGQPQHRMGGRTTGARSAGSVPGNRSLVNEGPIPEKPTSVEICKFGVGCTNKRCPYSHPSPVATQASGMVLRADACPNGRECKDPDCPYSHVSPAQVNGEYKTVARKTQHIHAELLRLPDDNGPSKILCKFPNCTNPTCPFRHEDANGNPIPPPALTRKLAESSEMETDEPAEQDVVHVTMDHTTSSAGMALDKSLDSLVADSGSAKPLPGKPLNGTIPVPCRFGSGCTNPKCKFIHDNRKPCNFGVKCFKGSLVISLSSLCVMLMRSCLTADCPYSHPPGRKLASESINRDGFSSYKPKEGQLVDRTFGGEAEPVEKVLPGSGLNVKSEPAEDDIKVEMG